MSVSRRIFGIISGLFKVSQSTQWADTKNNLIEEMADVLLNIEQIYYLLGNDIKPKIENMQNFKGSRWYRRTFITNNRPELE